MSSSAVANFSSSNKGSNGSYTQSYDDLNSDFFDQFLTFDNNTMATSHESPDYSILPTHFDDGPIDGGLCGSTSPDLLDDLFKEPSSSHNDSHMMIDSAASFNIDLGSYFYAEVSGRAAISDPELLSFENITLDSPMNPQYPQTSPSSPSKNAGPFQLRKNRITASVGNTLRRATGSIDRALTRSPIKKAASSKTLRTSHSNTSQEFWERKLSENAVKQQFKLEDFDSHIVDLPAKVQVDLTFEDMESPVSSPAYAQTSTTSTSSISPETMRTPLVGYQTKTSQPQSTPNLGYDSPMHTPTLEPSQTIRTKYESSSFPVTPRSQNNSGSWSQMPGSGTYQPFTNTNEIVEMDDPLWWSNASSITIAQPSPSGYHTNPQRATKSMIAMQLQNDVAYNSNNDITVDPFNMSSGLGIQMPSTSSTQDLNNTYNISAVSPAQSTGFYANGPIPGPRNQQQRERQQFIPRTRNLHSYSHPNLGVSTSHISSNPPPALRKSRSHPMNHSHNGLPSPSFPQYLQRQHSGHKYSPREQYTQHASLSHHSHHSQSYSDSDSASPCPSPSLQVRKRKSAKSMKKSAGGGAGGPVDFVNYTPSDSRKILTGVAPSGSSKTKARREKEALDKRRKLSQAAVRAVRAAGGDVGSLVGEGLFC